VITTLDLRPDVYKHAEQASAERGFTVPEAEAIGAMLALAAGELAEDAFAKWLRERHQQVLTAGQNLCSRAVSLRGRFEASPLSYLRLAKADA